MGCYLERKEFSKKKEGERLPFLSRALMKEINDFRIMDRR
jgi:hypothetical protein